MEQDRELLELAAMACGFKVEGERHAFGYCLYVITPDNGIKAWNPLTDDGDALQMAVRLGLTIATKNGPDEDMAECYLRSAVYFHGPDGCAEKHKNDAFAATRRAIVRAAAEIGRRMKEQA